MKQEWIKTLISYHRMMVAFHKMKAAKHSLKIQELEEDKTNG